MGYKDADDLRRLYWDDGKTQAEIADHFGQNPGTIHYWMEKHDIQRRDRQEEVNNSRRKGDRIDLDGKGMNVGDTDETAALRYTA